MTLYNYERKSICKCFAIVIIVFDAYKMYNKMQQVLLNLFLVIFSTRSKKVVNTNCLLHQYYFSDFSLYMYSECQQVLTQLRCPVTHMDQTFP